MFLCILDCRVLIEKQNNLPRHLFLYFVDCLLGTIELILTHKQNDLNANEMEKYTCLEMCTCFVINRLFNNQMQILSDVEFINGFLLNLNSMLKQADLNACSNDFCNALFAMIFNLNLEKLDSDGCKYIDLYILFDTADTLIDYFGKFDKINSYMNLIVAKALVLEIETNPLQNSHINSDSLKSKGTNEFFKVDLSNERIQTKIYLKLINKAKELLYNNKNNASNTLDFKMKSNGFNSIFELMSLACSMCLHDSIVLEEFRNPLIEQTKSLIFVQANSNNNNNNNSNSTSSTSSYSASLQNGENSDSIYIQLLLYWTYLLDKNQSTIYIPYFHALNNLKSIYLSSVQWQRNLSQNIVAFLSLPWLATESNGADLEFFKDKGYKQCSLSLIQNSPSATLTQLKCICIQLLCLLPKSVCSQWRSQIISRCVREEKEDQVRICALKYLPYLIYFLGVSSNSLVFQLIHPAMGDEKSLHVIESYAYLIKIICCLISRKSIIVRKINYSISTMSQATSETPRDELKFDEMCDYFDILCTCCDKKRIDTTILPLVSKKKNLEQFDILFNRPKNVDTQILTEFIRILSNSDLCARNPTQLSIRSNLLKHLERTFNHLEFSRSLDACYLNNATNAIEAQSNQNKANKNRNLTYIYSESLSIFGDDLLDALIRYEFARFSIPKLLHVNTTQIGSLMNTKASDKSMKSSLADGSNNDSLSLLSTSINDEQQQLDHNLNLENQLCEGVLRAKSSKSIQDLHLYIISLGKFALGLRNCDEYTFLCVKHLLAIFDSNENNLWSHFASSLAQWQLFILSKRINMPELLGQFEEKVCEIITEAILNSIERHQVALKLKESMNSGAASENKSSSSSSSYLQNANYALKDILKVFNINDSCLFVRNYQRYLVPNLISKATSNDTEPKIIAKSLEFISRKINLNITRLIEDNFPYIFTFVTLNAPDITKVFKFITDEIHLDIDRLINHNKQRLFNELLSKCGCAKYKLKVLQAICVLNAANPDEAASFATMQLDDKRIVKAIEPGLLAALIHFDMCLMKSSIKLKEKCQVLESLNALIALLGQSVITKVRYKIMTTLKLAMQQCSKLSELNCKLWDTFLKNVEKSALGAILNQVSVNLLQLLELQPYKVSKIFEYLIIQNKQYLEANFTELYFIPEHNYLSEVNQTLKKYTDVKYLLEHNTTLNSLSTPSEMNASSVKAIINLIKNYLKGASHENSDLRIKALEKLYSLLREKSSQIIYLIERQENSQTISEIMLALLNGCRDSDSRAKLLFGLCLGEIGAIDPANFLPINTSNSSLSFNLTNDNSSQSKKLSILPTSSSSSSSLSSTSKMIQNASPTITNSSEFLLNQSLVSEDSNEFSDSFSYSLIIELSKAYLAARHTHEQDSASYAIQECLKIYGCSDSSSTVNNSNNQTVKSNSKLWNSFPDYYKEILIPLRTSKYEIQSFDNLGLLKTPIILNDCKSYEEWIYKWCAYLISKIGTHFNNDLSNQIDKELKVFPKLQFIIRFNVNVALYILPYVIIKIIIQNINQEIIDQIFEEIMSVIKLNQIDSMSDLNTGNSVNPANNLKMMHYHHICSQTVFNIYDHLMKQLNYYRTKMNELQASLSGRARQAMNRGHGNMANRHNNDPKQAANELLLNKYKELFERFNKFIQRIPHQIISKAAFDCKAYCRSLMHYELVMRNTPGAVQVQSSVIHIKQEHLIELQNIFAAMDEIDSACGILVLKKGSEESLADAAFRHKINGRLNESIACLEQMLESNENAKNDIKQHETYVRTFISIGRHRNALSYLEGLMIDRPEWKEPLDAYRIETCWKLGSWDKLNQVVNTSSTRYCLDTTTNAHSLTDDKFMQQQQQQLKENGIVRVVSTAERSQSSIANTFNAGIGKLFTLVSERNERKFNEMLNMLREQQIVPLSAVSMESGGASYQRGYEYVVNLQALQEIETSLVEILRLRNDNDKQRYRALLMKNLDSYLIEPWERKILTMQPSFKHLEPIYSVRIALLNFLSSHLDINLNNQLAKLWLRLSKIARKAGMFENAYQYMLNAQGQIKSTDSANLEELLVEKSKWYWYREDRDSALFYLQKGLNELFNMNTSQSSTGSTISILSSNETVRNNDVMQNNANNELYFKVLLMYTKYSDENGSLDSETIKRNYLDVQKMRSKTEQAHYELAHFTDRLATSVSEHTGKKEKFWEYIVEIINYFASSLEYGCQFIYQSLPRMMSHWLDFGADYYEYASRENSSSGSSRSSSSMVNRNLPQLNTILVKLNQIVSNSLQRIPTYLFLAVYPQLVSRICHPEERVFETLSNILMKVLFLYPNQAIWMLLAVKNSSVELRKNRCKIIIDKAVRQQPDLRKFINDSSDLAEKLVQLGNLNVETGTTQISLTSCFKPLKRLVESNNFSKIIIPSQFQITLQLPSNESSANNSFSSINNSNNNSSNILNPQLQNFRSHNPYPLELVYINCFEDNVLVMNSLQKPKKVTIRGTDGKLYAFLCKSKDDLRVDNRIMEFFSVVNKCLKQEPESRRRNLYIRTYAVTPLNETSGIIEWIENLTTLRSILIKLYNERNVQSVTGAEWKQHEDKALKDKEYALKIFKLFLDRYRPTVLYEWFLRTFPEPNAWFNARSNYVRTAAVMSICGYVMGLGDRHCENILMASSNGDCIHVDFNCLFNKGETLGVPEIVPFRLTHNMIEAMGPLGYEGIFRKTCEVSLKILRDYKEPLITILKTFIYDPLVEWKTPSNMRSNEGGEAVSAKVSFGN
jgi:serine/threonine-protein kinase ATR